MRNFLALYLPTGCHLKCHKEHADGKDFAMQPCVGGEFLNPLSLLPFTPPCSPLSPLLPSLSLAPDAPLAPPRSPLPSLPLALAPPCSSSLPLLPSLPLVPHAAGESDVKRLLLLIKSNDLRDRWRGRLSQIAITRDSGHNTSPT